MASSTQQKQLLQTSKDSSLPSSVAWLEVHASYILHYVTPLVWVLLFVMFEDRDTLLTSWYMPFLGVVAAFLANSVPIGGGIVYIPALSLLGAQISLGANFTIAAMPFGNGVFGFLRWLIKDPTVFIWESFAWTVLPSWLGSLIAMTLFDTPNVHLIKLFFGLFCFFIGVLVLLAIYRGGLRNVFFNISSSSQHVDEHDNRFDSEIPLEDIYPDNTKIDGTNTSASHSYDKLPDIGNATGSTHCKAQVALQKHRWTVAFVSFLGGVLLVPNIGVGPALVTYFELVLLGFPEQRAAVTGIVTGGWVCVLPLALLVYRGTVPYALWVLVLPGIFYGAKFSPYLIEVAGETNVMTAFSLFLFASALLFWFH